MDNKSISTIHYVAIDSNVLLHFFFKYSFSVPTMSSTIENQLDFDKNEKGDEKTKKKYNIKNPTNRKVAVSFLSRRILFSNRQFPRTLFLQHVEICEIRKFF